MDEKKDAMDYMKPCFAKGQPCADIPVNSLLRPWTDAYTTEMSASAEKMSGEYSVPNTSVLDIVHQMDKFYADYRNTPVCMITAIQESIASLRGHASTEEQLQLERNSCNP